MKVEDLKVLVSVLRTVVGRSDEILKKVIIDGGLISAGDGCLRAFHPVEDMGLKGLVLPLETLWSFLKHATGDLKIESIGESIVLSARNIKLVVEIQGKSTLEEDVEIEALWNVPDFRVGLDYVSKPLDEDDFVEFHALNGENFIFAKSYGISSAYILDGKPESEFSVSFPYQSVRRLVKALQEIEGDVSIGFDGDFAVSVGSWIFKLCCERIERKNPPQPFDGLKIERRKILEILEVGADLKAFGEIVFEGESITVRGRGKGVKFSSTFELDLDLGFEAIVEAPFRKLRSYLSNMNSKYVILNIKPGFLRISDSKFKRFVFLRERRI